MPDLPGFDRIRALLSGSQVHTPEESQIQFMNQYAPGRAPVYVVSDPAYQKASDLLGGAQGAAFPQGMKSGDVLRALFSPVGRQLLMDVMRGRDPAVIPKSQWGTPVMAHEMGHQVAGTAPEKLAPAGTRALLPPEGWQNLTAAPGQPSPLYATRQPGPYGYSPENAQFEIPARLIAQPESLGMTPEQAQSALKKYVEQVRAVDPESAARIERYAAFVAQARAKSAAPQK